MWLFRDISVHSISTIDGDWESNIHCIIYNLKISWLDDEFIVCKRKSFRVFQNVGKLCPAIFVVVENVIYGLCVVDFEWIK